jgi:HEAT repeat protein
MRCGGRAVRALAVSTGVAIGCAGRTPATPPMPAAATPAPGRVFSQLEEAEPELLALEDRRAFDAAILPAAAASESLRIRARTALALGRIGDERAEALLRRLLADSSELVRENAAFGAGILGVAALSADLVPLIWDPDVRVATRAAWSIGFLEQSAGEEAICAAIPGAANPALRSALLRALWRFPTPTAAATAMPFVTDPDARIRSAALYALARRPQESSLPALTAAVADPDAGTAAVCARALGLLGKAESIGPLAAAIGGSHTPVTISAMTAAQAILEREAAQPLPPAGATRLLALAGDANPNLAVPALQLLRWLASDRDVFRRLWNVASTGRGRRQQVALQSLMAALGPGSESLVDYAIESQDPFLRACVTEALAVLPDADAASRRAKLASDADVVVRLKVMEGLRTSDAVRSARALVDAALADPDAGVRAAAIEALGRLEDPSSLVIIREAVVRSAGDREPDVPIAAIGVAEKSPELPEARAVVEAAYRHPSTLVSRLARRSLVKVFHADPAGFPWREYVTGKTPDYYMVIAAEA